MERMENSKISTNHKLKILTSKVIERNGKSFIGKQSFYKDLQNKVANKKEQIKV